MATEITITITTNLDEHMESLRQWLVSIPTELDIVEVSPQVIYEYIKEKSDREREIAQVQVLLGLGNEAASELVDRMRNYCQDIPNFDDKCWAYSWDEALMYMRTGDFNIWGWLRRVYRLHSPLV